MEEVISSTPYKTYEDLFNAIYNKKATIKINRSDCYNIASIKHPYFSVLGIYMSFIANLIITVTYCILINNFWLLLALPFLLFLPSFVPYISKLKTISWIFIIIDLLFLSLPLWTLVLAINIIIMFFFYNIWWNKTYRNTIKEFEHNQEAFLWCWNKQGLFIEDCFGNIYRKDLNFDNLEISTTF